MIPRGRVLGDRQGMGDIPVRLRYYYYYFSSYNNGVEIGGYRRGSGVPERDVGGNGGGYLYVCMFESHQPFTAASDEGEEKAAEGRFFHETDHLYTYVGEGVTPMG